MQLFLPYSYIDEKNFEQPLETIFDQAVMTPFTEYYQGYECNVMLQDYTLIDNPFLKSIVK